MSLISGNVTFGADAINCSSSSILGAAAFIDTASNQGVVSLASFSDTAVNEGTAVSAVFNDGAVNVGSLTSGTFLGTAVNSGVVTVAEFFGTASNVGVIVEAAKFADTSSNVGTVSGSAIFADTSVSNGIVEGAVEIAQTATQGESQALTETPTEYTQPDGYFPNAYYNGGVKAVPNDFNRKVYEINGFWYKYDNNGDGQIANGNYHDGVAWFGFTNGIKAASYDIVSQSIVLNNTTYYYASVLQTGERLYLDNLLINEAPNVSVLGFYLNEDEVFDDLVTDGSGTITITYGQPPPNTITVDNVTYYYTGTLTSGTTVLYTNDTLSTAATNIPSFNIGDVSDPADALADFASTDPSGVVTIVYGEAPPPSNTIIINNVTYYYTGTLTSGTTVLYTEDALTNIASGTTYADEAADIYYTIANGTGVYTEEAIATTTINTSTYYYTGTLTSGTTVLYTDNGLSSLANTIDYIDSGTKYSIDSSSVYREEIINTIGSYFYVGTFDIGTRLYEEGSLQTTAGNLSSANVGDFSSPLDGIDDYVSTDSNGYVTQINYGV